MNIQADPRISHSISLTHSASSPDKARSHKQLRQAAMEFESLFVYEMYKAMRKNVPESGLIQQSSSTKMFQEMLDMEMAKKVSKGEGVGIGQAIYDQLQNNLR